MNLFQILMIFYAAVSMVTFFLYGADKFRARTNRWRIRERTLLAFSFLGGSAGALLGMNLFRHKTRHRYFPAVALLGLFWQIALAVFLYNR